MSSSAWSRKCGSTWRMRWSGSSSSSVTNLLEVLDDRLGGHRVPRVPRLVAVVRVAGVLEQQLVLPGREQPVARVAHDREHEPPARGGDVGDDGRVELVEFRGVPPCLAVLHRVRRAGHRQQAGDEGVEVLAEQVGHHPLQAGARVLVQRHPEDLVRGIDEHAATAHRRPRASRRGAAPGSCPGSWSLSWGLSLRAYRVLDPVAGSRDGDRGAVRGQVLGRRQGEHVRGYLGQRGGVVVDQVDALEERLHRQAGRVPRGARRSAGRGSSPRSSRRARPARAARRRCSRRCAPARPTPARPP